MTESVGPTASIETIKILEDPINHKNQRKNKNKRGLNKVLNINHNLNADITGIILPAFNLKLKIRKKLKLL